MPFFLQLKQQTRPGSSKNSVRSNEAEKDSDICQIGMCADREVTKMSLQGTTFSTEFIETSRSKMKGKSNSPFTK